MYEFNVRHIETNEENIFFGYSWADAIRRSGEDSKKWKIIFWTYID